LPHFERIIELKPQNGNSGWRSEDAGVDLDAGDHDLLAHGGEIRIGHKVARFRFVIAE